MGGKTPDSCCVPHCVYSGTSMIDALHFDPSEDLMILSADHGEQFFEHGFWGYGHLLLAQEVHVPLIMCYDGFPARVHSDPVSLLDLFPTFCDLFSLPQPHGLLGESLVPTVLGQDRPSRRVSAEGNKLRTPGAAVIGKKYWYWLWADRYYFKPWHAWPFEEHLYRIDLDPGCLEDLIEADSGPADELNALLRQMIPHWAPHTKEAIAGSDKEVRFGPDLLETTPIDSAVQGPTLLTVEDGDAIHLTVPPARVRYAASGLEPGRAHYFEFQYNLRNGRLHLKIQNAEDETVD